MGCPVLPSLLPRGEKPLHNAGKPASTQPPAGRTFMKKFFWVPIALGLVAYLSLPLPGQSASLNDKIERKERQVERKRAREGVLTTDISAYSSRIRGLQGDIRSYAARE